MKAALNILTHSNKTSYELRYKLLQKGYSSLEVDQTIETLHSWRYLDDKQTIKAYIEKEKRCLRGPIIVWHKLKQKQIPQHLLEEFLAIEYSEQEEIKVIQTYLERKAPQDKTPKLIRRLLQKGFHYECVKQGLSTFFPKLPQI